MGLVKDSDIRNVSKMQDVQGNGDDNLELDDGWDSIQL